MTKMKRKGISSVSSILIYLATIVSAALVLFFFFTSTKSATNQPILDVTDAYYLPGTTSYLIFTIRNIGSVDVTMSSISVNCQRGGTATYSTSVSLPKGTSQSIKATASGAINDGDLCIAQVTLSSPASMSLTLSFRVIRP
jgi:flagellar basal body-associated protein FliL